MTQIQQNREFPLYQELPLAILSRRMRSDITRIIFCTDRQSLPHHIDTVMTLSAPDVAKAQAIKLNRIFAKHSVGQLAVTGGEPWKVHASEPDLGQPQSDVLLDELGRHNIPKGTVLSQERTSTNTKENVTHIWPKLMVDPGRKIVVVTSNWHEGRGVGTVRATGLKHGWTGEVLAAPFACEAPTTGMPKTYPTTWHKNEIARRRIAGELVRLWNYSAPGREDVYVDPPNRRLIGGILRTIESYTQDHKNGRTIMVPGADLAK